MAAMWDDLSDQRPEHQELSLRALTEAFSEVMGQAGRKKLPAWPEGESLPSLCPSEGVSESEVPSGETSESTETSEDLPPRSSGTSTHGAEADDPVEISPLTILEAMLFVGDPQNRPLRPETAASVMRNVRPEEIPELVRELNRRYDAGGCPYHIVGDGPGYRLLLRKSYWHLRNRFYARLRETRLSQAAIDVLAIVAYQQPVTAEQVEKLRGKPTHHILSHLVQRQLLRIERMEGTRKAHYYTTDRFLALFGLESLEDLPKTEDIDKK